MKTLQTFIIAVLLSQGMVRAEELNPVHWKIASTPLGDSQYELTFSATIDPGWHMYGLHIPEGGPVATTFNYQSNNQVEFIGAISPSRAAERKQDDTFEMEVELFNGSIGFTQKVRVLKATTLSGYIEFMACDDSRCLPPREEDFSLELSSAQTPASSPKEAASNDANATPKFETKSLDITHPTAEVTAGVMETNEPMQAPAQSDRLASTADSSLLRLFLIALLAGFGALLTPCVYPIIPLTVSFFMRDTSRSEAVFNGVFFGLSIVFIYTMVGLLVGLFKIDLVRLIASHWLPNLLFFLIFMVLAFSFFGMFELTLPGSLSNKIDQQADKGGFLGPFFMALATVVISFSCTGPIVGVVLGSALQGEIIKPVIGMLGFSLSFALPFTLLALFPGFMKKLPKSGGWLNSVKVFFAFILIAFALVFINNLHLPFMSRNLILALYIVIFALLGVYLLGKIRFSHDSPLETVSVPRLLLAIISLSIAVYLVPGLFGKPLRSIEPFLPEDQNPATVSSLASPAQAQRVATTLCDVAPKYSDQLHLPHGLKGYFDYDEALTCAKELGKPVLLDFVGHSCKNCKKMYAEVWSDPRVLELLSQNFIVAALYTDDRTKLPQEEWVTSSLDGKVKNTLGKKNNDLQITRFGTNALPMYAVVNPNGEVIVPGSYFTYNLNTNDFVHFLQDALNRFTP